MIESTADRLASEYKVSAPTITRDGQYAAAIDTLKHAGIDPHKVIAHEPKAAVVEFAKAIAPKPEPPAVPLLPPEPTKQKDPDTAETNVRYDVPHLSRRNLHPDQASYLRGKRYNGEKQAHGGQVPGSSSQNDNSIKSHERLAEEYKVSPATITRDGQYAAAIDTLKHAGIDPHKVIAHEPKAAVVEFAKAIAPKPEPPAVPLLPPEPTKQKDPDTAETNVR